MFELRREGDERPKGKLGESSGASLHAKTFAVDRSRIFIGSFNLDPRSARLNTEVGVVLESPTLAGQLSDGFDQSVPRRAYEVRLTADGQGVEWIEQTPEAKFATRRRRRPAPCACSTSICCGSCRSSGCSRAASLRSSPIEPRASR